MLKGKIVSVISFIVIICIGTIYNPFHYYYGFVEIKDLEQNEDEYTLEISGDFGTRKATFTTEDTFDVLEDHQIREDNISTVWNHLLKGKKYHMLVEIHKKKGPFHLERINFDYSS